jgi:hypothetical protein
LLRDTFYTISKNLGGKKIEGDDSISSITKIKGLSFTDPKSAIVAAKNCPTECFNGSVRPPRLFFL